MEFPYQIEEDEEKKLYLCYQGKDITKKSYHCINYGKIHSQGDYLTSRKHVHTGEKA